MHLIESIQDELPGYGYRRVTHELRRRGHLINHKRIARLMKMHGLSRSRANQTQPFRLVKMEQSCAAPGRIGIKI